MHGAPVEGVCVICTLIQAHVCAYLREGGREGVHWGGGVVGGCVVMLYKFIRVCVMYAVYL